MKHFLILNPASAGGRTDSIESEIRQHSDQLPDEVTFARTEGPGHATELTRDALRQGFSSILVAGGDGTFNEVVNGFYQDGQPVADEPPLLGIIPSGSGGDFSRSFSSGKSIESAFAVIRENAPAPLDLGKVTPLDGESRIFANICSTGLSASIGVNTNKSKRLKKLSGTLAFNWNILKSTLQHHPYPLLVRTESNPDGELWQANCVAICNGQYFGSGVRVAREADLTDGLLEIVVVHDKSPIGFLKGVSQIKADDSRLPDGMEKQKSPWCEITCNHPGREVLIEADGEYAGKLPARFEVLPGACRKY